MTAGRSVRVNIGDDGRPLGRDAELVALFASYQDAVVRSTLLDPVTVERGDPIGADKLAQGADVTLKCVARRGRRGLAPERVDGLVDRHALAGMK